jgi:hypothetical protein
MPIIYYKTPHAYTVLHSTAPAAVLPKYALLTNPITNSATTAVFHSLAL